MLNNKIEFKIGQQMRVISNKDLFKSLQQTCGGYSDLRMKHLPGTTVTVRHYSPGKVVIVEKNRVDYDLHPGTLELSLDIQLFDAIHHGDQERVLEVLDSENLNKKDNFGRTPVHLACVLGHTEIVKCLCGFEPDMDIPDDKGYFPIHTCALNRHFYTLKFLIEKFPESVYKKTLDGRSISDICEFIDNKTLMLYLNDIQRPDFSVITEKTGTIEKTQLETPLETISIPPNQSPEKIPILPEQSLASDFVQSNSIQESDSMQSNSVQETLDTIAMQSTQPVVELDVSSIPEKMLCKICYGRRIYFALYDCGHTLCFPCSERFLTCPFDRTVIKQKQYLCFNE